MTTLKEMNRDRYQQARAEGRREGGEEITRLSNEMRDLRDRYQQARAEGRREAFEEVKALNVIALLREQVERRSQALQNPNPGGQHVPDHSDFSHAQPSTITRLQWYLRAFDAEVESLASKGGGK